MDYSCLTRRSGPKFRKAMSSFEFYVGLDMGKAERGLVAAGLFSIIVRILYTYVPVLYDVYGISGVEKQIRFTNK